MLGQFPENPPEGDYRILWIGDPQVMPVPAWTLQPGIGYAITDDGPLTQYETWPGRPSKTEAATSASIVRQIASESTLRGGRLLAPYAIRYIVVPVADGATSTVDATIAASHRSRRRARRPARLRRAADPAAELPRLREHRVDSHSRSVLRADADATRQAGLDSLARLELRPMATPVARRRSRQRRCSSSPPGRAR